MLALVTRSHVAAAGTAGRRVTGELTPRPSGCRGHQRDINRSLLGVVVQLPSNCPLSDKVLSKDRARHPTRVERVHSRARVRLRPCASFSLVMGNKRVWTSEPPWSHRFHLCLPSESSLRRQGQSFQHGVPYKLMRLPGLG